MEIPTKKFPSAMTAEVYASSRSNFVIPSLDGELRFVDIRNGKSHEAAYLVYIGRPITTADVLQKLPVETSDLERAQQVVDSLLEELARFKVGNVVAVESSEGGKVRLRLVANAPKSRPGPKLRG